MFCNLTWGVSVAAVSLRGSPLVVCANLLPDTLLPAAGCILWSCPATSCSLRAGVWKRGRSRAAPDTGAGESDALEPVHRHLRGLLNRLTEENMQVWRARHSPVAAPDAQRLACRGGPWHPHQHRALQALQ